MSLDFDVNVNGLKETQEDLTRISRDLHSTPMVTAMRQAVLLVEREAKKNAPVFTGQLRSSIQGEVRTEGLFGQTVKGVIGSNALHAPWVELGTKPHWPPIAALEVWAQRKGLSAYLVARAIATRGTKAVRYLQRAIESNQQKIINLIEDGVTRIIRK